MKMAASQQVDAGYSMVEGRSTQIGTDAALSRKLSGDGAARRRYLRAWMKLAMHSF